MALDKLVDSTQLDADLTSIANAIRTKGGTSAQLAFPQGFVSAIEAISGGGGSIKCERGSVTLESDWTWSNSYPYYAIPHGLGEAPELVILWPTLTDDTGPERGYIVMDKPMGEARQKFSSSSFGTGYTHITYTVSSFDDPVTSAISFPGSSSYCGKDPDASNIYLSKFASRSTWRAGTYNYFIASGWIQEE